MSNLIVRTITGLFFVLALVGGILGGIYPFLGLFLIICLASNWELLHLLKQENIPVQLGYGVAASGFFFLVNAAVVLNLVDMRYLWLFIPVVMLSFIFELFRGYQKPFLNLAYTWVGVCYLAIAFLLLANLAMFKGDYQKLFLLSIFVLIWSNDTFAYLTGRWLGNRQLFKRISPNKTWEGTLGGTVLTLVIAFALSPYLNMNYFFDWLVLGGVVVVFGTFGDLLISMLKRQFERKDAGNLLPGHGGVLDRFDALIFIVPAVYTYLALTYQ